MLDEGRADERDSIKGMLELAEVDCAYCILETYESVYGEGSVLAKLHISTVLSSPFLTPHPTHPPHALPSTYIHTAHAKVATVLEAAAP
jgi:hypothetical protein